VADVSFQRADYQAVLADWKLLADVVAGERAVKAAGTAYLPKPNPADDSDHNRRRYEQYKLRAVFYGATGNTLAGLIGAAFRKAPETKIPDGLAFALSDIDGAGISIYQQAQKTLGQTLLKGRCGLLVDYPETSGITSVATQRLLNIRATTTRVNAENIINWRTEMVGGSAKLSLVVISESHEVVDGFGSTDEQQFRVLRLIDGVYFVEIWRMNEAKTQWVLSSSIAPTRADGSNWDQIPFVFVGAENNDHEIDRAPLLPIALLNLAHYRNSADYEDSVYFCGQPQPWMSGLDVEWRNHLQKTGITIGSGVTLPIPKNGAFGIEQASPNTLAKEAMDQKERQMISLGARVIERSVAAKTATEVDSNDSVQHSILSLAASNVSAAYTKCLGWMAEFMGVPGGILFEISREFASKSLDPQMITALVGAWQSGKLPESDLWNYWRKHGLIEGDKGDESIKAELDASGVGLGLE